MAYEVRLEVFEGPIDLLLHLITRQRVDIYDVSLATITDEYLAAVAEMERLDLDGVTGFLVVAATLLELKSTRLLPQAGADELDAQLLEERDMLLARLVECATFREAGAWMGTRLAAGDAYRPRVVSLEPQFAGLVPDLLAGTDVAAVAAAARRALTPRPAPELDTSHVAEIRASVGDAIVALSSLLEAGGAASFEELCHGVTERVEVVVRFLALLELFKAGAVDLSQANRFGAITARWTGEASAAAALAESEEYGALEAGPAR